jgi:hypothetical protein
MFMVTARSAFALVLIATFVLSFAYFFVIPALETETTRPAVFEENPIIALGTNQTPLFSYNLSALIYDDFNYNGSADSEKWVPTGEAWEVNGTHLILNNTAFAFCTSAVPIQTAGIAGIKILFRNTQIFYTGLSDFNAFSFGLLKDSSFEFLAGFTILDNGTLYADIYSSYIMVYHTEIADLANGSVNSFDLSYYDNGTLIFKKGATTLTASNAAYINPSSEAYLMLIDNAIAGCRFYIGDICNFSQPFPVIYSYSINQAITATASDAHFNHTWVPPLPLFQLSQKWLGYWNAESRNKIGLYAQQFWFEWVFINDTALIRFKVDIPQDSTLDTANLSLFCSGKAGNMKIAVQLLTSQNCPTFSNTHLYEWQVSELSYTLLHQVTVNAVNGWNVINIKTLLQDFIQNPYYVKGNWIGFRIMPVVNTTYIFTTSKIYIASSDSGSNAPILKANYRIPDYQAFTLALTSDFKKASFVNITGIEFDASNLQLNIHARINLAANFNCQANYTLFETLSDGLYNLSFKNYNTLALKRISYNQIHAGLEYHNLYNMSRSNTNKLYFNYLLFDCITTMERAFLAFQYINFENIVLNIGNNSVSSLTTQLNADLHSYFYVQNAGLYFRFNTSYNAFNRLNFTLTTPEALHYTSISLTAKATIPNVCYLAFYTDNPLDSWNTMPLPILFNVGNTGVGRARFYYQQADNCTQLIIQCTSNALYQNLTATGYIIEMAFTTTTELTQALVNIPNLVLALIILIVPGALAVKFIGKGAFAPLLLVSDVACLYLGLLQWWVGIPVAVIALFIIFEGRN